MANSTLEPKVQNFISQALKAKELSVDQLAGDASSRRYFRVIHGEASYVLMVWEPFNDDGDYPFLNVLNHFAKHKVNVPAVVAKAPDLGVVLL
jgi:aminoglycoside/choline kinase family phosphotransferase